MKEGEIIRKYDFNRINGTNIDLMIDLYVIEKSNFRNDICFLRNSYDTNNDDLLAIKISESPYLIRNKKLNIFKKDLEKALLLIKKYNNYFIALASGQILFDEFIEIIGYKGIHKKCEINESYKNLFPIVEMAKLLPSETGLEKEIWVDEDKQYKVHGSGRYRLKIQPTVGNKGNSFIWPTFLLLPNHGIREIEDNKNPDGKSKYSKEFERDLKLFVDENLELLKDLADKKIDLPFFKANMIKLDPKTGLFIYPENEEDFYTYTNISNEIKIVINKESKFNILKNDEILFNDWFDFIVPKMQKDQEGFYFVGGTEKTYKLYINGRIYLI